MRILFFIDTLRSGGKERQLVELLKGLVHIEDIECELIIMSKEVHYDDVLRLGIPIHYLLRKWKKDLSILPQLYCLCKKIRPDIVHSWSSMCSVYAVPIVKLQGIIFVNGFLRDVPPTLSFKNNEWLRSKLTFPFSHAIVANSQAGLKAYNAPQTKSYCIHNGFDLSRVNDLPNPQKVRASLNIQTDKVVGMVASFTDKKDYPAFLEAARNILAQRDDVTFIAVGDGKNLVSLQKEIPELLQERIKFLGKQKNLEAIVNIFTVGVLTSNAKIHGEGISNSIMEYMALNKPVLATDCGGNRELISEGEIGFIIKPGDVNDLINKLLILLDDNELAQQLGHKGYQRIANKFSMQKMTKEYIILYQELTNK